MYQITGCRLLPRRCPWQGVQQEEKNMIKCCRSVLVMADKGGYASSSPFSSWHLQALERVRAKAVAVSDLKHFQGCHWQVGFGTPCIMEKKKKRHMVRC